MAVPFRKVSKTRKRMRRAHNALTAKTVTTDLVAGHAYNFTIALSVGALIQFTVTTNPTWGDSTTNVPVLQ